MQLGVVKFSAKRVMAGERRYIIQITKNHSVLATETVHLRMNEWINHNRTSERHHRRYHHHLPSFWKLTKEYHTKNGVWITTSEDVSFSSYDLEFCGHHSSQNIVSEHNFGEGVHIGNLLSLSLEIPETAAGMISRVS